MRIRFTFGFRFVLLYIVGLCIGCILFELNYHEVVGFVVGYTTISLFALPVLHAMFPFQGE